MLTRAELIRLQEVRSDLAVSIYLPTHRVGDEIQQDPIRLKNLISQTEDRLDKAGLRRAEREKLLAPAQDRIEDDRFWQHQSDGLALFLSEDFSRSYRLPLPFEPVAVVSDRFHTKPLIPLLTGDGPFYILALSQNEVRLLHATKHRVGELELHEVPESLAEFLKWDDPEAQLQWHTGIRAASGRERPAAFHGHGVAGADRPQDDIRRYFRRIDEGLGELLAGETAPMVLAGVEYLHPIYHDANTYPHLLKDGIEGNPEELSPEELHQRAWPMVEPRFLESRQEAEARFKQLVAQDDPRASSDVAEIVPSAHRGRVDTLFVALDVRRWGRYDPAAGALEEREEPQPGDEDLLDLAAVQTLSNDGTVFASQRAEIPGGFVAAAVFRY